MSKQKSIFDQFTKSFLTVLTLLFSISSVVLSEEWTNYNSCRAEVRAVDGEVSPNGQIFVLFSEVVTFSETNRSIRLARLEGTNIVVETIDSFPEDLNPGRFIQLVGDDESV